MKRLLFVLISSVLPLSALYAQLSLSSCYEKAAANYPQIRQYDLIEQSKNYNLANIGKGYLPQIQLGLKATYQSEVTKVPIAMDGIKALHKDQYGATLEMNQSIWDGGSIHAAKAGIRSQSEVERKRTDVTVYAIRQRVNELYFAILLHDEMLRLNQVFQNDLSRNYQQVATYQDNGLANKSDLNQIKVEQVKAQQNYTSLLHSKKSYLEMLSRMINQPLDLSTELDKPEDSLELGILLIQRPELAFYEAQIKSLGIQRMEVKASLMPKLNLFATGGYGRPGLNMLEPDFSFYYMGGISLKWNFSSLYTRKNKLKNIQTSSELIETSRETFLYNNRLQVTQSSNEIDKMREVLKSDDEIIALRGSIKQAAQLKLASGTLSVLDYMHEINAEQEAKLNKIIHEIELLQAIHNLKFLTNN
ncbi:TolC family protein [Bacteroides propionicifaciens]|uniref:TolC family protein n=1 Tax=Bacteroides propionicifaciens TaxID=392838 RepID=UPI00037A0C74|nr:TolC family protein [Bacteroides propionicifaciens]